MLFLCKKNILHLVQEEDISVVQEEDVFLVQEEDVLIVQQEERVLLARIEFSATLIRINPQLIRIKSALLQTNPH